jgi:ankyrin repeat protein
MRNISTNDLIEPPSTKTNVIITQHAYSSLFESVSQSNLEETRGHLDNGQSPRATNSSGDTPLHIASKTGSIDIVRILLEYGANPNSINSSGLTPLHLAVKHELPEIVKILLTFGADSNMTEFDVLFT